jgi:hypothetical protein
MEQLNPHGDEEYATLLQRQGRIMRKQILVLQGCAYRKESRKFLCIQLKNKIREIHLFLTKLLCSKAFYADNWLIKIRENLNGKPMILLSRINKFKP